jgi:hypothetical protein
MTLVALVYPEDWMVRAVTSLMLLVVAVGVDVCAYQFLIKPLLEGRLP